MSSDSPHTLPLPLAMAIVDRSVTVRGSPRRAPPSPAPSLSVRGQQRLIRQAIIQAELEAEERDALRMSADEYRILHDSFKSVKAEFSDLDGLSWDTPAGREMLARWHAQQAARDQPRPPSPPIGGVPMRRTNAAVPAHSPVACTPATSPVLDCSQQDTVRPSRSLPTGASLTSLFASLDHPPPSLSIFPQSPATEHDASDDTVRFVPIADSRRSSTASTIVPDRDGPRTPLPALFASLDKENEGVDVDRRRPALPKSHSAPSFTNPFADDPAAGPSRPTRPLPPSRIPVRSKSLSAKPSATSTPPLDASFVRRHASSAIRRVLEPRALLTASMVRNALAPAPADAAPPSPSPAKRTRPSLPEPEPEPEPRPEPPRSPARRAPPDLSVRSGPIMRAHRASGSKFRIVSAPPLRTIPTRPPAPPPTLAPASLPERARAGPDSPLRVLHVSRPRVGGVLVAVVEPARARGKRGRALDDTGDGDGLAGVSDARGL